MKDLKRKEKMPAYEDDESPRAAQRARTSGGEDGDLSAGEDSNRSTGAPGTLRVQEPEVARQAAPRSAPVSSQPQGRATPPRQLDTMLEGGDMGDHKPTENVDSSDARRATAGGKTTGMGTYGGDGEDSNRSAGEPGTLRIGEPENPGPRQAAPPPREVCSKCHGPIGSKNRLCYKCDGREYSNLFPERHQPPRHHQHPVAPLQRGPIGGRTRFLPASALPPPTEGAKAAPRKAARRRPPARR